MEPGKDIQKSPDQSFLKRPCKKDTSGVESLEIRAMFFILILSLFAFMPAIVWIWGKRGLKAG